MDDLLGNAALPEADDRLRSARESGDAQTDTDGQGFGRRARQVTVPLAIFAGSRAALFGVLALALRLPGAGPPSRFLTSWDGAWYLRVAREGYPRVLAQGHAQSDLAFFPLYPMLIRAVHQLTGRSFQSSALSITLVASALAMVIIWRLVERLTDSGTASRSVALLCFFPWGFILSMAYSEGLLLLTAAICLLALLDERWVLAGLSALLAGAARPNGFVLILPCAWAALVAFRRQRHLRPLLAPVLAPLGILGFFFYLWLRTGDFLANLHARSRGWPYNGIGPHVAASGRVIAAYLAHPFSHLDRASNLIVPLLVVVALVGMVRWRPPAIVWLYVVPVLALAVWFDTYASMARFALTAFPLVVPIARSLKGPGFRTLLGVSAALMATLFVVVGTTTLLTP